MLKHRPKSSQQAQSMLEYTLVISLVAVMLFAMSTMVKRGIQGMVRVTADQIGIQKDSDQFVNDISTGHLDQTYIATRADTNKTTREFDTTTNYILSDRMDTESNALLNLGFTEENLP